jgi:hypothetical protein
MHGRSAESPIGRFHQRELNELKNVTVHRDIAVAAALDYCAEEGLPPPQWVVQEASALLCELLCKEKSQQRGRAGNRVTRYRNDQWDVERWNAVEEIRRYRSKAKYDAKLRREYGETPKNSKALWQREQMLEWLRNGTFECASRYLTGRDAKVGSAAVRASYRRCIRRAGTGTFPNRYYRHHDRFLEKIGIPSLQDQKPGMKFLYLYDLK